jgi:hypothetical protein
MAKLGKRLAGLLGSETVDKLKNIGTDAIGDVLGTFTGTDVDKDKSDSAPPPSGKRFDEPAPDQASAVEATPTAPATTSVPGSASVADKVIELNRLRESGVLSDAEFAALKAELLGS